MSEKRLNDLLILSIESDTLEVISFDTVFKDFVEGADFGLGPRLKRQLIRTIYIWYMYYIYLMFLRRGPK